MRRFRRGGEVHGHGHVVRRRETAGSVESVVRARRRDFQFRHTPLRLERRSLFPIPHAAIPHAAIPHAVIPHSATGRVGSAKAFHACTILSSTGSLPLQLSAPSRFIFSHWRVRAPARSISERLRTDLGQSSDRSPTDLGNF